MCFSSWKWPQISGGSSLVPRHLCGAQLWRCLIWARAGKMSWSLIYVTPAQMASPLQTQYMYMYQFPLKSYILQLAIVESFRKRSSNLSVPCIYNSCILGMFLQLVLCSYPIFWKMEWNSEHMHTVAGNLCNWHCPVQVKLPSVSLGLLSHCRSFIANRHASISQHGTIAGSSKACTSPRNSTWFTRQFLLVRGDESN